MVKDSPAMRQRTTRYMAPMKSTMQSMGISKTSGRGKTQTKPKLRLVSALDSGALLLRVPALTQNYLADLLDTLTYYEKQLTAAGYRITYGHGNCATLRPLAGSSGNKTGRFNALCIVSHLESILGLSIDTSEVASGGLGKP